MDMTLENSIVETDEDVKNILDGLEDVKNGKTMPIDDAIKKFFIEREAWKSLRIKRI